MWPSWPGEVMAVENFVFVAGVIIRQGPDQGLSGHFARLSRPHQSITYMFFCAGGINDGLHYMFSARRIIDNGSHYMLAHAKGRVGARRSVKHASKQTSETAASKGKLSPFFGTRFRWSTARRSNPKCAKMWRREKKCPHPAACASQW